MAGNIQKEYQLMFMLALSEMNHTVPGKMKLKHVM